ncbi:flagellar biosynthesis protein FliQ [Pararhodospirillum photometricum]|uniref:Flagellar biosynthetic protein FliQ n=1 Tax=Pararhodospirillum photometricum DSM 122 TaxID=1150469 RepID=H6SJ43_PARPM|nr:flagellar biosynthesis protein FliQ [Pararhodospirillum photometricum]CCG08008.1 Flagellar biosynthesis protein FliQ [Pararhodospirillum photometricum DSM 122]
MEEGLILDLSREAVWLMILVSGPALLVGMVIGVAIALVQTLTQIQEMTLVFVPKILLVFGTLLLSLPWMVRQMTEFMTHLMDVAATLP